MSVFTLTLLFFALSVAFQAFSAMGAEVQGAVLPTLQLNWYHKLVIALMVSSYLVLAISGPNRASRQSFEERVAAPYDQTSRLTTRIVAERAYAATLPLATLNVLIFRPFWYPLLAWSLVTAALSGLSLLAFFKASTPNEGHHRRRRDKANIYIVGATTIGLTVCTLFAGAKDAYWVLTVTVALVPAIICIASTSQPTLQSWRQGQRYLEHRKSLTG